MKILNRKLVDKIFDIGILVKAIFGFFELEYNQKLKKVNEFKKILTN